MELTTHEVKDIALLARIGITDQEAEHYQKDLSAILAYFEQLKKVNTDDVEEIGHITGIDNVFREDVVDEMSEDGRVAVMDNVPNKNDNYIKVKNVL
jgi:aspartyl-tRNA(Asn)/glutamyl-tRNA(Gln) amidotransferase subunit C